MLASRVPPPVSQESIGDTAVMSDGNIGGTGTKGRARRTSGLSAAPFPAAIGRQENWIVQRRLLFGPLLEIFCQVHKMEALRIIPPEVICQTSAGFGLLSEVVCIHDAQPMSH